MAETIIRPTMKFVYLWYLAVALFVVASLIVLERVQWPGWIPKAAQPWLPFLPILLIWIPVKRQLRNRLTKMTLLDDRLRLHETGFMSRTARTILIANVQDVTVHTNLSLKEYLGWVISPSKRRVGRAGRPFSTWTSLSNLPTGLTIIRKKPAAASLACETAIHSIQYGVSAGVLKSDVGNSDWHLHLAAPNSLPQDKDIMDSRSDRERRRPGRSIPCRISDGNEGDLGLNTNRDEERQHSGQRWKPFPASSDEMGGNR